MEEKALLDAIRSMLEAQSAELIAQMDDLKTEMRSEMTGLKTEMRAEMSGLKTEMRAEMTGLKTEMRAEMSGLKTEMRAEMSGLKTEMSGLKTQMDDFKTEVNARFEAQTDELKTYVREEIQSALLKNNSAIADIVTEAGEKVTAALRSEIDAFDASVKEVETVTARNAFDVQLIKGRAQ